MIVKMSKAEIIGVRGLLGDVLSLLRERGVFQIEPTPEESVAEGERQSCRPLARDGAALTELRFLRGLLQQIDELLTLLPDLRSGRDFIPPHMLIDVISRIIEKQIETCRNLVRRRERLEKELEGLKGHQLFFETLAVLLEESIPTPDIDFIGFTLKQPQAVRDLHETLDAVTDRRYDLVSANAVDGTLVGLITIERSMADTVKKSLQAEQLPDLPLSTDLRALTFREKMTWTKKRIVEINSDLSWITGRLERLALRRVTRYRDVREWIADRLSLLDAASLGGETRYCFLLEGWIPTEEAGGLRSDLRNHFGDRVTLLEKEIGAADRERIPIVLRNPRYIRPFELFSRLLPLPVYTSYDPTPFIAIFFPVFFGLILGDAGYGLLLLGASILFGRKTGLRPWLKDALRILGAGSAAAVVCGVIYGEFFGEIVPRIAGYHFGIIDRRNSVIPMFLFALAVGTTHILLGLFLGALSSFRRRDIREGVRITLTLFLIPILAVAGAATGGYLPPSWSRPSAGLALLLIPPLVIFGGVFAPLDLVKTLGNIISYVRIAAIGLTSVLLAMVANLFLQMSEDALIAVLLGGLLHLFNIILGVFSPTIHSLRLHYVEFFTKFIEPGGRRFEPLSRPR